MTEPPAVRLRLELSAKFFSRLINYPVMVEKYHLVDKNSRQSTFSAKRRYFLTFTERERELLQNMQKQFEQWHLHTGMPPVVTIPSAEYLELARRAIAFFATL